MTVGGFDTTFSFTRSSKSGWSSISAPFVNLLNLKVENLMICWWLHAASYIERKIHKMYVVVLSFPFVAKCMITKAENQQDIK